MIDFHAPTLQDRDWIAPILYAANFPGADYTFNNMYFWSGYYGQVGRIGEFVTQRAERRGRQIYLYPAGQGDVRPALEEIFSHARRSALPLRLRGITNETKAILEQYYPGKFVFTSYRDAFDYIYTVEELCNLQGKKLQAKRNHINRFISEHPAWRTEQICQDNVSLCETMLQRWYEKHGMSDALENEQRAISYAMTHFDQLQMDGLMILDGDEVVAFSMGTRMNAQYYDVNFEKSFADLTGGYAIINREFSRMIAEKYPDILYLNREDDMGLEGLRKAKESYQPTLLLEKFVADLQEA